MKKLFISAAAVALLSACGGNNTDADVEDVVESGTNAAVDSAQRALEDLGNITLRSGDAGQAANALAAMSLSDSGSGRISFAGSNTDGDGATFTDVAISVPDDDGDEGGQILVGTLEFDGLDMVDGEASFSKMSMTDIRLVPNDPEDAEEGELTVDNVELLNPSPALAAWVASLTGNEAPGKFPTGADLSFDAMTLSNMNFSLEDGSDTVDFDLGNIQFLGASETGVGVAKIEGVNLNAASKGEDPVMLRLGSISMTGIGEKVMNAMQEGFEAGLENADPMASQGLMEAIYADPLEPGYDSMLIDDVAFEMGGVDFTLPSLAATVQRNSDGQAVGNVTEPFTMTLSADAEAGKTGAELAGMLGMLGYEQLTLTGAGKTTINPETDTVIYDASENYYTLEDGFTLRFGADMSGISEYSRKLAAMDLDDPSPDPAMLQDAASELVFSQLTIQFEDDSIVDRAFNLYAAQSGEDPAAVRQQAVSMIQLAPMMAAGAGVDMTIVTEFTTAAAAFLQEPGTLTISLDPQEPLSMATFENIQDPSMITKDMLGLSVTHE
ncbi:MAG: hypothetical protein AAFO57_06055 [Pseudomonadota bacterium]